MSKSKNYVVNLATNWLAKLCVMAIALVINFYFVSSAIAATQSIQLNSIKGYKVETTFSYSDDAIPLTIKEQGQGKTNTVNSMQISFYDPAGKLIATYDNIVDSIARGNYFEFNFDPATQKMLNEIDLGGESAGEIYLKGDIEQGLALIEVSATGKEKEIDRVLFK